MAAPRQLRVEEVCQKTESQVEQKEVEWPSISWMHT